MVLAVGLAVELAVPVTSTDSVTPKEGGTAALSSPLPLPSGVSVPSAVTRLAGVAASVAGVCPANVVVDADGALDGGGDGGLDWGDGAASRGCGDALGTDVAGDSVGTGDGTGDGAADGAGVDIAVGASVGASVGAGVLGAAVGGRGGGVTGAAVGAGTDGDAVGASDGGVVTQGVPHISGHSRASWSPSTAEPQPSAAKTPRVPPAQRGESVQRSGGAGQRSRSQVRGPLTRRKKGNGVACMPNNNNKRKAPSVPGPALSGWSQMCGFRLDFR